MASKQANVDFVLEQLQGLRDVSARKMFGEYAIYLGPKVVALFCDDQLFVKPTRAGRAFLGDVHEAQPYPGAKPWFLISGDRCEDADFLCDLVRRSAAELPLPKPKSARPKTKVATKSKAAAKGRAKATPEKKAAAKKKGPGRQRS